MAPVQKTFSVIPDLASCLGNGNADGPAGPPSKPPMTTKQAKKLYKAKNTGPKLSKAEQRRIELMEQDRIRRELEKERNQARALRARDKRKEREEKEKTEKKKRGMPLFDVRPSQDTIARFVRRPPFQNVKKPVPLLAVVEGDSDFTLSGSDGGEDRRSKRRKTNGSFNMSPGGQYLNHDIPLENYPKSVYSQSKPPSAPGDNTQNKGSTPKPSPNPAGPIEGNSETRSSPHPVDKPQLEKPMADALSNPVDFKEKRSTPRPSSDPVENADVELTTFYLASDSGNKLKPQASDPKSCSFDPCNPHANRNVHKQTPAETFSSVDMKDLELLLADAETSADDAEECWKMATNIREECASTRQSPDPAKKADIKASVTERRESRDTRRERSLNMPVGITHIKGVPMEDEPKILAETARSIPNRHPLIKVSNNRFASKTIGNIVQSPSKPMKGGKPTVATNPPSFQKPLGPIHAVGGFGAPKTTMRPPSMSFKSKFRSPCHNSNSMDITPPKVVPSKALSKVPPKLLPSPGPRNIRGNATKTHNLPPSSTQQFLINNFDDFPSPSQEQREIDETSPQPMLPSRARKQPMLPPSGQPAGKLDIKSNGESSAGHGAARTSEALAPPHADVPSFFTQDFLSSQDDLELRSYVTPPAKVYTSSFGKQLLQPTPTRQPPKQARLILEPTSSESRGIPALVAEKSNTTALEDSDTNGKAEEESKSIDKLEEKDEQAIIEAIVDEAQLSETDESFVQTLEYKIPQQSEHAQGIRKGREETRIQKIKGGSQGSARGNQPSPYEKMVAMLGNSSSFESPVSASQHETSPEKPGDDDAHIPASQHTDYGDEELKDDDLCSILDYSIGKPNQC